MSDEPPTKPPTPKKKRNPFHRKPVPPLQKHVVSLPDVDVRQLPREDATRPPDETLPPDIVYQPEDEAAAAESSREARAGEAEPPVERAAQRRPRAWALRRWPGVEAETSSPDVGLLTVREVADLIGITPHALRERMRRRGVPVTKIGYMSLIARSDIERLR